MSQTPKPGFLGGLSSAKGWMVGKTQKYHAILGFTSSVMGVYRGSKVVWGAAAGGVATSGPVYAALTHLGFSQALAGEVSVGTLVASGAVGTILATPNAIKTGKQMVRQKKIGTQPFGTDTYFKTVRESAEGNIMKREPWADAVDYNSGVQALRNGDLAGDDWSRAKRDGFDRASEIQTEPDGDLKVVAFAEASQLALQEKTAKLDARNTQNLAAQRTEVNDAAANAPPVEGEAPGPDPGEPNQKVSEIAKPVAPTDTAFGDSGPIMETTDAELSGFGAEVVQSGLSDPPAPSGNESEADTGEPETEGVEPAGMNELGSGESEPAADTDTGEPDSDDLAPATLETDTPAPDAETPEADQTDPDTEGDEPTVSDTDEPEAGAVGPAADTELDSEDSGAQGDEPDSHNTVGPATDAIEPARESNPDLAEPDQDSNLSSVEPQEPNANEPDAAAQETAQSPEPDMGDREAQGADGPGTPAPESVAPPEQAPAPAAPEPESDTSDPEPDW